MKECRKEDYFGQCVPEDASMNYRIEAASGLLCLSDPEHLKQALFDAGLHVVVAADKAVLDASGAIVVDNLVQIAERNGRRMSRWARAELARRNGVRVLKEGK